MKPHAESLGKCFVLGLSLTVCTAIQGRLCLTDTKRKDTTAPAGTKTVGGDSGKSLRNGNTSREVLPPGNLAYGCAAFNPWVRREPDAGLQPRTLTTGSWGNHTGGYSCIYTETVIVWYSRYIHIQISTHVPLSRRLQYRLCTSLVLWLSATVVGK